MRADDLDLVYEKDLPADAVKLPALLHTFEPNDATLRDLFRLNLNESVEPTAPQFRTPSLALYYARRQNLRRKELPCYRRRSLHRSSRRYLARLRPSLSRQLKGN